MELNIDKAMMVEDIRLGNVVIDTGKAHRV